MGLLFVIGIYIGVVSAQAAVTCNIKQYNGANINTATEVILLEVSGLTNAEILVSGNPNKVILIALFSADRISAR